KPVTEEVRTTLGIDLRVKPFRIEKWEFTAIDMGGQELYQKVFWSLGVSQADAVIYMIDGTIRPEHPDFKESLIQFKYMLNLVEPETPLLILVNKQDLIEENPLTIKEAIVHFEINKITGRSMSLLPSSAKYGDGIEIAMKWLVKRLNEIW
ncbi:MAG: ADP-ribosylation factor-like protein, partial [Candidatus Hodarchaeota archaeon]